VDDTNVLITLEARLSGPLRTVSLRPQSKKAAAPAWHFYRSSRISTSTGSVSLDRMVYYSWGSSPCCLSCSVKLSCKDHYLPCLCLSRGHFAPVFSYVTDKHLCLKGFRFTAPRYSQVEQLHTKQKQMPFSHKKRNVSAALCTITCSPVMKNSEAPTPTLLQPYVLLAQPLSALFSETEVQENPLHPLPLQKQPLFKTGTARRMIWDLYESKI